MSSKARRSVVSDALIAHGIESPNAEVRVMIDGASHSIWGHSIGMLPLGVPEVVLLSEDSTTTDAKIHRDAERNFAEAARRLVQEGVEFFTLLRPTWAVPAVRWTRAYV